MNSSEDRFPFLPQRLLPFQQLTDILKSHIPLTFFQEYLYLYRKFSVLTKSLRDHHHLGLQEYHDFLAQQFPLSEGLSVDLQEITPSPVPSPDLQNLLEELTPLYQLSCCLLEESKIDLATLNVFLKEISPEGLSPKQLLQVLFQRRKIKIEDFMKRYAQDWNALPSLPPSSFYRFRLKQGELELYIKTSSQNPTYGEYAVLDILGRGGMGLVYRVYHPSRNQIYALKVVAPGVASSSEKTLLRFQREIHVLSQLQHPGIVQWIEAGQEQKEFYFVMEFVQGRSLNQWQQEPGHSLREGVLLIQKCLDAVHYAHEKNVIHRDLKPENILISWEEQVKITDFGLARERELSSDLHRITQTGTIVGTPVYMAPEQALGEETLDPRGDVYSLGMCLYRLLTSQLPFSALAPLPNLLNEIQTHEITAPSTRNPEIHRDLDWILLKALQKTPEKRYESALAFAEDLQRFLEGLPIQAKAPSWWEKQKKWIRKRRSFLRGFFFLFLWIMLLCVVFYHLGQQKREERFVAQLLKIQEETKRYYEMKLRGLPFQQEALAPLFNAFNALGVALSLKPGHSETERKRLEIGRILVQVACEKQEYAFAAYIANELQLLQRFHPQTKKELFSQIQGAQEQVLRKHQRRFRFWMDKLSSPLPPALSQALQKDAIFELSRMTEREIFELILSLVEEGAFSKKQANALQVKPPDFFYLTLILALGRSENSRVAGKLAEYLEQLYYQVSQRPEATLETPEKERILEYMVALANALADLKVPSTFYLWQRIREEMGEQSLFWIRTRLASRKIKK